MAFNTQQAFSFSSQFCALQLDLSLIANKSRSRLESEFEISGKYVVKFA
jgi:hypothetical protein